MNAVQCACGLRLEREIQEPAPSLMDLTSMRHDWRACSARVGYESQLEGARRMVEIALDHLAERRTLSGAELSEIRTVLVGRVMEVLRP